MPAAPASVLLHQASRGRLAPAESRQARNPVRLLGQIAWQLPLFPRPCYIWTMTTPGQTPVFAGWAEDKEKPPEGARIRGFTWREPGQEAWHGPYKASFLGKHRTPCCQELTWLGARDSPSLCFTPTAGRTPAQPQGTRCSSLGTDKKAHFPRRSEPSPIQLRPLQMPPSSAFQSFLSQGAGFLLGRRSGQRAMACLVPREAMQRAARSSGPSLVAGCAGGPHPPSLARSQPPGAEPGQRESYLSRMRKSSSSKRMGRKTSKRLSISAAARAKRAVR